MAIPNPNIFMATVETEIINRSHFKQLTWKKLANNYHPTVKFTAEISDKEITFLDTCIYKGKRFKKESILDMQTYFTPTETFAICTFHLLPPSRRQERRYQRRSVKTSENQLFKSYINEENITQFKRRLRGRGYPDNLIENTLSEIKFSERMPALQNKQKTRKRVLPFVTEYCPSVPNLKNVLMSKWHLIENQPLLRQIYKDPPLLSYRKGGSLENVLVRAKL